MSRIGNKPVAIPAGVKIAVGEGEVHVEGKHGRLSFPLFPDISVRVEAKEAVVVNGAAARNRQARAWHGLVRAYLANMVRGVSQPWERKLAIEGTGFSAKIQGNKVVLLVGFSHPVELAVPEGIKAECPVPTEIVLRGVDRARVGQFAANIRRVRPPDAYKGKGVRYAGEAVKTKPGKSLTSGGK